MTIGCRPGWDPHFSVHAVRSGSTRQTIPSCFIPLLCSVCLAAQSSLVPLCRFLLRIEQGYPCNPYHSRVHAADVLRSYHTLLTRGGVLPAIVASACAREEVKQQQQQRVDVLQSVNAFAGGSAVRQA